MIGLKKKEFDKKYAMAFCGMVLLCIDIDATDAITCDHSKFFSKGLSTSYTILKEF